MSEMLVILRPQAFSARTADSRPGPGPPTRTSTFFTPCSCAATPAFSAATCAANGVDLREPRKPQPPEVDQESVFPWRSVIVMMVLLKEACTWAMPSRTFLRAFFGFFAPPATAAPAAPPAAASDFFSAATCAANGVDLREPRKPQPPEVAQESVFPWRSVIVMMVLLKEACTWAMPSRTFLRAFFGFFAPPAAAAPAAPPAAASDFFSSAMCFYLTY